MGAMTHQEVVTVGIGPVSIEDVVAVARHGARVELQRGLAR